MSRLHSSQAFTLVELLVVITIVVVLAGLALPVFGKAQGQSQSARCAAHLRQLGIAALLYASENNMTLPVTSHQSSSGGKSWTLTLQQYAGGKLIFRCPADEQPARAYSYVINDFLTPNPSGNVFDYSRLSRVNHPGKTFLFGEASKSYTNADHFHFSDYAGFQMDPSVFAQDVAVTRHNGAANYVFADGHLEMLRWGQVQLLIQNPSSAFIDTTSP